MNFVALDVAIGLIFVYFMLSLAVLAVNEAIATLVNFRAWTLKGGIDTLVAGFRVPADAKIAGKALRKELYKQPLIDALHERRLIGPLGNKAPSYIPPRTFILSLLAMMAKKSPSLGSGSQQSPLDPVNSFADLEFALKHAAIPEALRSQLQLVIQDVGGDVSKALKALESWFDDAMERVTATYKARIHSVGLLVALVVTLVANADTLAIVRALATNPTLRAAMVAQAQEAAKAPPPRTAADSASRAQFDSLLRRSIQGLDTARIAGLPLGYPKRKATEKWLPFYWQHLLNGLGGLVITALAVSLGAPFWFDLLNKVVNVRGAGRAPEEKPKSPEVKPPARGA